MSDTLTMSDADLLDIAAEFRDAIVGTRSSALHCALVCWPLAGYLAFLGLDVQTQETIIGPYNHVWIELPDGRVLDPTADQFDASLPAVYLGPKLAIHRRQRQRCHEEPCMHSECSMPQRIQMRRDRPWQIQPKALKVDRSTGFGNFTTEATAAAFAQWLEHLDPAIRQTYLAPLRGRTLACWCPLTRACHADVLLDWANR